jgi:hypothetical protein
MSRHPRSRHRGLAPAPPPPPGLPPSVAPEARGPAASERELIFERVFAWVSPNDQTTPTPEAQRAGYPRPQPLAPPAPADPRSAGPEEPASRRIGPEPIDREPQSALPGAKVVEPEAERPRRPGRPDPVASRSEVTIGTLNLIVEAPPAPPPARAPEVFTAPPPVPPPAAPARPQSLGDRLRRRYIRI